jgi:hypothetical protein
MVFPQQKRNNMKFVYNTIGLFANIAFFLFLLGRHNRSSPSTGPTGSVPTQTQTSRMLRKQAAVTPPVVPKTGSFVNCTTPIKVDVPYDVAKHAGSVTISCQTYHYKVEPAELWKLNDSDFKYPVIIYAVLSSTKARRDGIRQTWKQLKPEHVFFIVSGPFEDYKAEYDLYRDILWIDVPKGATDATKLLFAYYAIHKHVSGYRIVVNTHDDVFVNHTSFAEAVQLFNRRVGERDYLDQNYHLWGKCVKSMTPAWQWGALSDYPYEWIPNSCRGAGTFVTKIFLSCAIRELPTLLKVDNEYVAQAMLAERCHVIPDIAHQGLVYSKGEMKITKNEYWMEEGFGDIRSMVQRWNGTDVGSSNPYYLEGAVATK